MNALRFMPLVRVPQSYLVLEVSAVADDQFSSPKQIRYSAALGKLLVAQNVGAANVGYWGLRNPDLSFYSKFYNLAYPTAIDSDNINFYCGTGGALLRSYNLNTFAYTGLSATIASIRMIDASGDPDYVYVTSNNAANGHGVRKVRKSDMTVVASLLATGSGDGQFNNPLGVFYYDGYVYVCDSSNSRIVKLDASDLSFVANVLTSFGSPYDICTDGSYFYIAQSGRIYRYDMSFTDATKILSASANFYSITLIPDQGDGNGATIAITDFANCHIARYKCSDLTQVGADVGSSGDGSASLFDPVITGSDGTWYMDDGQSFAVASGANISWNGFSGYTFKSAGPHRAVFRPAVGGLAAVTALDCNGDLITSIKNLNKCRSLSTFYPYNNPAFSFSLRDIVGPINNLNIFDIAGSYDLADLPEMSSAVVRFQSTIPPVTGALSSLRGTYTAFQCPLRTITGSLSDIYSGAQTVWLYGCTGITPASIAHLTAIRDLRIHSMGWLTAGVDTVIDSIWAARAAYTYALGPSLNIGGTNQSPTGNYVAPVEGSDWHEDTPGHWTPLTPKAKIYDLMNDVNSEGFNVWAAITYT